MTDAWEIERRNRIRLEHTRRLRRYSNSHKLLDYHSVQQRLNEITAFDCGGYRGNSQYYSHYRDWINTFSCDAAAVSNSLERLAEHLGMALPQRKRIRFECWDQDTGSGILWFNQAIAFREDSNLLQAMENEGVIDDLMDLNGKYEETDYNQRQQRQHTVERLPKAQHDLLLLGTMGVLYRFGFIDAHFIALRGMIDGLDYEQALIVEKNGDLSPHIGAWL